MESKENPFVQFAEDYYPNATAPIALAMEHTWDAALDAVKFALNKQGILCIDETIQELKSPHMRKEPSVPVARESETPTVDEYLPPDQGISTVQAEIKLNERKPPETLSALRKVLTKKDKETIKYILREEWPKGGKIKAIKYIRELTWCGLKLAHDYVSQ